MTDDELRALVRDAIARHLGDRGEQTSAGGRGDRGEQTSAGGRGGRGEQASAGGRGEQAGTPGWRAHPSFGKFLVLRNDDSGACLIEPTVECNHCGFCLTYGH